MPRAARQQPRSLRPAARRCAQRPRANAHSGFDKPIVRGVRPASAQASKVSSRRFIFRLSVYKRPFRHDRRRRWPVIEMEIGECDARRRHLLAARARAKTPASACGAAAGGWIAFGACRSPRRAVSDRQFLKPCISRRTKSKTRRTGDTRHASAAVLPSLQSSMRSSSERAAARLCGLVDSAILLLRMLGPRTARPSLTRLIYRPRSPRACQRGGGINRLSRPASPPPGGATTSKPTGESTDDRPARRCGSAAVVPAFAAAHAWSTVLTRIPEMETRRFETSGLKNSQLRRVAQPVR
jgi:hypothetical protein